jgi:hypothetical protein
MKVYGSEHENFPDHRRVITLQPMRFTCITLHPGLRLMTIVAFAQLFHRMRKFTASG